ncbi:MAG: ABC transporter permease [Spirochaetaceae bacterium]|jgi:lipoprotein-releasing system permease protein|nr:ABC transporter permease [Spirochaetaceae bacterium]
MSFLHTVKSEFFIAFRYLFGRSNKGERYLLAAAAGIALSLIPIMVTLIVTDGMIQGITERFLELGTGHIQVRPSRNASAMGFKSEDAEFVVKKRDGVRGVWKEIDGVGIILGLHGKTGTGIRAIDPSFWEDEGSRKYLDVIAGEGAIKNDNDVLLGSSLAKKAGAEIAKTIRIMTLRTNEDGKTIPHAELFYVRGIISSGYHEIDANCCVISYNAGKKFLDPEYSDSYLVVKIDDPYLHAEQITQNINKDLRDYFRARTWQQVKPAQYSSYETTRQILLFIMALIVLIAAVNVSSATSMLVIERERDIAVLKTCGLSPAGISAVFLLGSFLTGLSGAVLGITLGLLCGIHINQIIHGIESVINIFTEILNAGSVRLLDPEYYLQSIPIIIDWKTVFIIVIFTVICSITASAFPSFRAGRMKPVELLRKY